MINSKTILVVSEDLKLRSVLQSMLDEARYAVLESDSQADALAQVASKNINLVICDVEFSGMEDLSLLKDTKSCNSDLPFVLITAYASVPKAVTAIQAGAADYITTPFTAEVLLET